jgi:TonB family protein
VQAVETKAVATTPAQLAGNVNLCTVQSSKLNTAIKHYRQRTSVFETISFGIVAQCDSRSVYLALPDIQGLKWAQMRQDHPEMTDLWDLSSKIVSRLFGVKDIFQDRTEEDDIALQHEGEKFLPELISGRFDAGLTLARTRNIGHGKHPTFGELLDDYRGPIREHDARPQLVNREQYQFTSFTSPIYPPLAAMARIEGRVDLRLAVDKTTGEVRDAAFVAGHPLLKDAAIAAAQKWRFAPNSAPDETFTVTLDFSLRCSIRSLPQP